MASEQAPVEATLALSKYSKRVLLKTLFSHPDGGLGFIGQRVVVGGWVKSSREFRKDPAAPPSDAGVPKDIRCVEVLQTKLPFFRTIIRVFGGEHRLREKLDAIIPKPPQPSNTLLQISDGSCTSSLQVLVESWLASPSHVMPTGTCILAEGVLQKPSLQGKHIIELKAEKVLHLGVVDQDRYPLSKKRLPLESLRDSAHFRPRTTTVASVMRMRNGLTQATNAFFQENGFVNVQVPVITTTDCEGLGKNFQVIARLGNENVEDGDDDAEGVKIETIKASIKEKSKQVEELKRSESNKEALAVAVQDLKKTTELVSQLQARKRQKSDDFFSCKTYITTSGRLHLESFASALGNVYSFGPTFHANRHESKKLLAEMWMVELEMAFTELEDAIECAVDFLKFICKWILENCTDDIKFVSKRIDKHVVDRLQLIAAGSFEKISYTDAVDVLKKVSHKRFEKKVEWGVSLSEEHESCLTDEICKKPVIIYDYPKQLKPFNVRSNSDGKTSAAFEVIVPKVGTLIRGTQSEERVNILSTRIKDLGLEAKQYEWYVDLHKHGAVKCSGFSFLFDPLVLYGTGLNDARDAVPFPRSFGEANN